jgi:hypothetical protein
MLPIARDLGATAVRITLRWHPNQTQLEQQDRAELDRFVPAAIGLRVVAAVYGSAADAPQTDSARAAYCDYVANLVRTYPAIRDVVIWNEANLGYFWQPQFNADGSSAAPAAYAALLATCWDKLHATRPDVNIVSDMSSRGNDRPRATSNVSHSPVTFVKRMGDAYRFSARDRPLLDTVGLHPYSSSGEAPWIDHGSSTQISQGDIAKLVAIFGDAFSGSAQPLLGTCVENSCPHIWLLETGYQTRPPDAKRSLYTGEETDDTVLPDTAANGASGTDQATQMKNAIALAYCQPSVGAIFNFLLADEPDLANWQSGLLWADGTPKASYPAFGGAARSIRQRAVDCAAGAWNGSQTSGAATTTAGGSPPATSTTSGAVGAATPTPTAHAVPPGATRAKAGTPTGRPPRSAPHARRAPASATRVAIVRLLAKRFRHGVSDLEVVRSARGPWYLADGFDRRTRTPVAAWFRAGGTRLRLVAVATSARQAHGPANAPCDIRPAFSRPICG